MARTKKIVDRTEPSVVNLVINEFFEGRAKNSRGEEWFSPADNPILPKDIRDIYESLNVFFRKKEWYVGGPIPDELLYTKRNFKLINNIALLDAVEWAYKAIEQGKFLAKTGYKKNVEITITLRIMHDCERKDVRQDHIGGIIVLYLELCERVGTL